ncbi:MAG: radical SAM protein [Chlorobi bacterium]|nr:radical SAM protein [Chlorobiota bacterium]
MYSSKKFRPRPELDVFNEIRDFATYGGDVRKVFLADGNATVLSTDRLLKLMSWINKYFPKVRRISSYALPADLISKSDSELKQLYEAGLKLLYIGIESGDDELLKLINKGETAASTVEGINKAQKAGIQCSVMILNGLGGKKYSEQHAINSAKLLNEIQPDFLSTLVLSFPYGEEHYKTKFEGDYQSMSTSELLAELKLFLEHTDLKSTVFRSDHASNYLILKGILGRSKQIMIEKLEAAISNPESAGLRPEYMRGL